MKPRVGPPLWVGAIHTRVKLASCAALPLRLQCIFIVRVNSLVVGIFHSTGQICFWGIQNTLYSNADTVTPVIQTARTRPCDTVMGCTIFEIARPNDGWTGL